MSLPIYQDMYFGPHFTRGVFEGSGLWNPQTPLRKGVSPHNDRDPRMCVIFCLHEYYKAYFAL